MPARVRGRFDDRIHKPAGLPTERDVSDKPWFIRQLPMINGFFEGEHRMRQGKTLPYEPSLRTPLLVRGLGVPHGVVRTAPLLTIDFAPTILRVAEAGLVS